MPAYLTDVLGGRLVFAIEGMGARVAMVELTDGPPAIKLNDHLDAITQVFVYRVARTSRGGVARASGAGLERGPHPGDPAGTGPRRSRPRAASG